MEEVIVKIKKINEEVQTPIYQTNGSAAFDLHSIEEKIIPPNNRTLVRTGLKIELPQGYELQIRPRSGLALKHGITVLNSPGTVDSDYRGEIGIILFNTTNNEFIVKKGDRIAQAVVNKVEIPKIIVVEKLNSTERGEKGFGSTGV